MSKNPRLEDAISRAYEIIGKATPLKADCGILCGAACCKDAELEPEPELEPERDPIPVSESVPGPEQIPEPESAPEPDPDPAPEIIGADPDDEAPGVSSGPGHLGMILFPGEEGLLSGEPGYRFFRILYMGAPVWFLVCEGVCDRRKRPLACRIFPLAPHVSEDGIVYALPDPRAARICPLAGGESLEPGFRRAVAKAFRFLSREPEIIEYMRLVSADLDEIRKFLKFLKFKRQKET